MSDEKIQIRIMEPLPRFADVINPIVAHPPVIGERVAVNAINPTEVRELVLAEVPRDEVLEILNFTRVCGP